MKAIIRTETGSVYYVRREEGQWFLSADNIPNANSEAVNGEWEIQAPKPWPAILGNPMLFTCIHFFERAHPNRMPGGGKYTSRVTQITTPVENCPQCGHIHWEGVVTICGEDCTVCEGTEPLLG